jgi:hypothetical protein
VSPRPTGSTPRRAAVAHDAIRLILFSPFVYCLTSDELPGAGDLSSRAGRKSRYPRFWQLRCRPSKRRTRRPNNKVIRGLANGRQLQPPLTPESEALYRPVRPICAHMADATRAAAAPRIKEELSPHMASGTGWGGGMRANQETKHRASSGSLATDPICDARGLSYSRVPLIATVLPVAAFAVSDSRE